MKRVIALIILLTSITFAQSPAVIDTTASVTNYASINLKTAKDTVCVKLTGKFDVMSIVAYTTTGTDTLFVSTKDRSGTIYTRKTLKNLTDSLATTNNNFTKIIVTSTAKEWIINDVAPSNILIMRAHKLVTTKLIVAGKRESN